MNIKRRSILSTAGTASIAATIAACSDPLPMAAQAQADGYSNPRIPAELHTHARHIIHRPELKTSTFNGGSIYQANEENFPILSGEDASIVFVELEPGGIREPHWHPSAWETNIIISGQADWTVLEPGGYKETFVAKAGDVVFMPQGSMHYFRNNSHDQVLKTVIVFNVSTDEAKDDISVANSISALPPEVLAAVFKVPVKTFANLPKINDSITITRA